MKRLMSLCMVLTLAACSSTTAFGGLLNEDFESDVFPPEGWSWEGINVQPFTWHCENNEAGGASFPTSDGVQFAMATMAYNHLGMDEWLISPTVNSATDDVTVGGLTLGSAQLYGFGNYDLELWVINGDIVNDGDDMLVGSLGSLWLSGAFAWTTFEYDLSDFVTPGQDFRIGFRHLEINQASTSCIDGVFVTPEPTSLALLALGGLVLTGRRRG